SRPCRLPHLAIESEMIPEGDDGQHPHPQRHRNGASFRWLFLPPKVGDGSDSLSPPVPDNLNRPDEPLSSRLTGMVPGRDGAERQTLFGRREELGNDRLQFPWAVIEQEMPC